MQRPKLELADVFRRYGEAYRQKVGASLCTAQRRVMTAIEVCRTAALGGHVQMCDRCGHLRNSYNSCGNRHCPKCQSLARAEWIQDRQSELLSAPYFHVVFTLPEEMANIAFQNKRTVYGILFRAAAETLQTIAADPQHLGAEIGFFAVLHTWGQTLVHHPHLHCVVPGGGLSPGGKSWIPCHQLLLDAMPRLPPRPYGRSRDLSSGLQRYLMMNCGLSELRLPNLTQKCAHRVDRRLQNKIRAPIRPITCTNNSLCANQTRFTSAFAARMLSFPRRLSSIQYA